MKLIIQSIRQTLLWTVIAGVVYPLVITVIAQVAFTDQANGSLVYRDGKLIGSALLAQQFTGPTISGRGPPPAPTAPGRPASPPPAAATSARPAARCKPMS